MAPKMATIVEDVTSPPAVPPPIKYTSSHREDQRLSSEGKIVSKYCNMSKTLGGPSTPLVSQWGYEFACTSKGSHE